MRRIEARARFFSTRTHARRADLVYVSTGAGCIRLLQKLPEVPYTWIAAASPSREQELARDRLARIPPAWTDVWIAADPASHIQATGRDQKGRKQYRYHPEWTACRDEAKFSTLAAFGQNLPRLRRAGRLRPAEKKACARTRRGQRRPASRRHDDPHRQRSLRARQQEFLV